jgi:hypothetical protein
MNLLLLFLVSVFIISAIPAAGSVTTAQAAPSVGNSPVAKADSAAGGVAEAATANSSTSCVSNGFLTAEVDGSTGTYGIDIGGCATAGNVENYILLDGFWSSFATVADFTTGAVYTEGGDGGGTPLGTPASSGVVGSSIVTIFPPTAEGLVVTQNITVTGSTFSDSAILMNVKVVNTNPNPQKVGVRYLWDVDVGGYDGTWLREYNGTTAGAITGYETDYSPPPASFTSYALGGCSQGSVVPPPYTCDPSDFGAASGTFVVSGSISSGPEATTPARFVYGWWRAIFGTAYRYLSNPSNEIGSYTPNVGGAQDSAVLYYFSNETLPGTGGVLSDQADITASPGAAMSFSASVSLSPTWGAAGTSVSVSATGLASLRTVTLTSFGNQSSLGSLGSVTLSGACATDVSGNLSSSEGCTFLVPASTLVGVYTVTFSDGTNSPTATFRVTPPGVKLAATLLGVTCSPSTVIVGSATTCEVTVQGSGSAPSGSVGWSSRGPGEFSGASCKLSQQGSTGTCSVKFAPTAAGSPVVIRASYGGDSGDLASAGTYDLTVTAIPSTTTVSCHPTSVPLASSRTVSCQARVTGILPMGIVTWSQSGTGGVRFVVASCTLLKSVYYYITYSKLIVLHELRVGICSVTLMGVQAGSVVVRASYEGDSGNAPGSGTFRLSISKVSTTVTVACSPTAPAEGAPATCTATVLGGHSPTGTVTWSKVSGTGKVTFSSKTCTLSSGSCSVIVTASAAGSFEIKASYGGDSNNLKSSGTLVLTVS